MAAEVVACTHYVRRCSLICPECDGWFPCRLCHDSVVTSHVLDRFLVTRVRCDVCGVVQDKADVCGSCDVTFGKYSCLVCSMYDDTDKGQFHCGGCGLCRVGGKDKFTHCHTCGLCLSNINYGEHKCLAAASQNNCSVCMNYLHDSRDTLFTPSCQHILHSACYADMCERGLYRCPQCNKSLQDMKTTWLAMDAVIARTQMPAVFRGVCCQILCTDCNQESICTYHVEGLKCALCGSYNTTRAGEGFLRLRAATSQGVTDGTPVTAPEIAPESTPEVAPASSLEVVPESAPEVVSETAPEVIAQPTIPPTEPRTAAEVIHLYEAVDLSELDAGNPQPGVGPAGPVVAMLAGAGDDDDDDDWEDADDGSEGDLHRIGYGNGESEDGNEHQYDQET